MSDLDLQTLIDAGESATVEFKKSTAEKDRACRTLCGFANAGGGQLLFGVTPEGKLVGQQVTDRTLEELAQEFRGFEPPLFPEIRRVAVKDSLQVLVLRVERPSLQPVTFRGVPYERVLNTTQVMSRSTYQRLLLESLDATDRWEIQPADCWTLDMLDSREIVITLEESIRRGRSDDPGSRDPLDILRGLGLLTRGGRLSRAAVALFCKNDNLWPDFPQLTVRLARFKGHTRNEFLDNRQYHGNAFDLMRRTERFLLSWLPVASRVIAGKLEREDTPLLPVEAVREALANAFVHRDYASGGGAIAIALYDDRLEIISPGELHFGLTPEQLLLPHESRPWNPLIATIFYRRGFIEAWGRGTIKIAELLRTAGLQPSTITSAAESVTVTFWLPKLGGGVSGGVSGGVTGGVTGLFAYLQAHPGKNAAQLAEATGLTRRTTERWLKQLRLDGKIEFRGAPKTGGYFALAEGLDLQPGNLPAR